MDNPSNLKVERSEVLPHNVHRGKPCWGITDGKKWFFYGYPSEERASAMLPSFSTPTHVRINISYDAPMALVN